MIDVSNQQAPFSAAEELGEQLKFETLLAEISARLVNLPAEQVDGAIEAAQREICECLGLEHSSVWQGSRSEPGVSLLTHLFRDASLPPRPDRMDGDTYFPWAQQKQRNKEIVRVPRTADVPPEAATDKQTWQAFGIKSALGIPLWVGDGPTFGLLSFDATTEEREWPDALVKRLQLIAQVFANALARKQFEQALVDSEKRLRLAAEAAKAGLWTLEPISGQIWATDETKAQLGLGPAGDLDLKRFLALVHPDDREPVQSVIGDAIQSGEERSIQYRIIRPDGAVRWISSHGRRSSGLLQKPQLMGVSVDVTEQRKTEETLHRHSAIVRSSNDAILSIDLQGVVSDWNAAAELIYGYAKGEVVGKHIGFLAPPELRGEQNTLLRRLAAGEHIQHLETVRLRKDGTRVDVSLTISPIKDREGRIVGASTTARDISHAKRNQGELQESYAEIKRLKELLEAESHYLQEEIRYIGSYDDIVGQSKALAEVLKKVEQVAGTDSLVLITGESGTGKELIARAIHNQSKRQGRAMVKVDCASLPSTIIESELFGREKGAYTGALTRQIGRFETADGSTLFLDEIGELALDVQAKLLRVVQDGEFERLGSAKTSRVNVRLIAATHRDLAEKVKNGTFREDLYYRLNVFPIHVPPLRERAEDIPLLVTTFLREFEKKMDKKIRRVPSRVMDELRRYPWPGNIRELRNVIERAVIVTTGEKLNLQLPQTPQAPHTHTLGEAERHHIVSVLNSTGWRIKGPSGAATILGMKPSTLYDTMRRLQIPNRNEKYGLRP